MGKIFLSIALSIDGLGLGISFGMAGTKITGSCYAVVFGITFLILKLSIFAGKAIGRIIPEKLTVFTGSGILIALGIYLLFQKINEKSRHTEAKVFQSPQMCDIDNSGSIEMVEGIFIAAALSADAFGAGIGLSAIFDDLGLLPVLMAVFQTVFLYAGYIAGNKINTQKGNCLWRDFLPAGVLILIGIAGLKTGGKLI